MGGRYTLEAAKRAIQEPDRLIGEVRRWSEKINSKFHSIFSTKDVFQVMDADWDILIIIDACRFDLFTEEASLSGETAQIETGASQSYEYMKNHFIGDSHHETVYVSANPYTSMIESGTFHAVKNVYADSWDKDAKTVLPKVITESALNAATTYPEKQLLIHYMQPHYPFIGEIGNSFHSGDIAVEQNDIWTQLRNRRCPVDVSTVWDAYAENYRIVEPELRDINQQIEGKTVVTSDHGNLFGERLRPIPTLSYGHPTGVYHPHLRQVPWHEFPVEDRREVRTDPPESVEEVDKETVTSRLKALGYQK